MHDTLPERLAERLGPHVEAKMVYAPPVEREGLTVIPVARIRYLLGGGSGEGADGEGGGGGAAVRAEPVGFIHLQGDEATFKPILTPASMAAAVLQTVIGVSVVVSLVVWATGRATRG